MNRIDTNVRKSVVAFALALAGAVGAPGSSGTETTSPPSATTAEHLTEAAKADLTAVGLERKAQQHKELAHRYAARASGGSKQGTAWRSVAKHHERLAEAYLQAATETSGTATSHRDIAKAP